MNFNIPWVISTVSDSFKNKKSTIYCRKSSKNPNDLNDSDILNIQGQEGAHPYKFMEEKDLITFYQIYKQKKLILTELI